MMYSTGNDSGSKLIGVVVALVLFLGFMCVNAECSARTCPEGLTPTFTREGCVCLMRAK